MALNSLPTGPEPLPLKEKTGDQLRKLRLEVGQNPQAVRLTIQQEAYEWHLKVRSIIDAHRAEIGQQQALAHDAVSRSAAGIPDTLLSFGNNFQSEMRGYLKKLSLNNTAARSFNPGNIIFDLQHLDADIARWRKSKIARFPSVEEGLRGMEGYARYLRGILQIPPRLMKERPKNTAEENMNNGLKLAAGSLALGGAILNGIMGIFSGDFRPAALYLGTAVVLLGGDKILEPKSAGSMRQMEGITRAESPYNRYVTTYGIKGKAWSDVVSKLMDGKVQKALAPALVHLSEGRPLTEAQQTLILNAMTTDSEVREQLSRMMRSIDPKTGKVGQDFLHFASMLGDITDKNARKFMEIYAYEGASSHALEPVVKRRLGMGFAPGQKRGVAPPDQVM